MCECGGLTLARRQVPTKVPLSLPFSAGQGRKHTMKGSQVKIRTRKVHSPIAVRGKTDLIWGNLFN